METKTYILRLDSQCNQRCLFCMSSSIIESGRKITYEGICKEITIAKDRGYEKIDFYGGEPTTYPFLINSMKFANNIGLRCSLATNAIKLSSIQYTKNLFSTVNIEAIRTSLHSHQPKIHDKITQVRNSYNKTLKGIVNILEYFNSERFCVNIVVTSLNYKYLACVVKLLYEIGVRVVKFSGLSISGRILKYRWLIINPSLIQSHLLEAIELCDKLGLYWFIEKFPFCIAGHLNLKQHFFQEKNGNCIKIGLCHHCRYNELCYGMDKSLLMLYGIPKFYQNYEALRY